jgi:poly(3-hydroxybutyrate) depolymerase
MKRRVRVLVVVMVMIGWAVPALAQPLPQGLSTNLSVNFGGQERTFDVFVPQAAVDGTPRPLVLELHGFGSNSLQQRGISGWLDVAQNNDLIVVWPNAVAGAWGIPPFSAVDDVGFLVFLTEWVSARSSVEPSQVHLTGFSLGGDMTGTLACQSADRFGAFVSIASGSAELRFNEESCSPVRPIPVLNVRGTTDLVVPFAGGPPPSALGLPPVDFRSADEQFAFWRQLNNCSGPIVDESLGAETSCQIDSSCDAGVQIQQCQLRSISGQNPEGLFDHILYFNSDGVNLAELSWSFMQRHPLPDRFLPSEPLAVPILSDRNIVLFAMLMMLAGLVSVRYCQA